MVYLVGGLAVESAYPCHELAHAWLSGWSEKLSLTLVIAWKSRATRHDDMQNQISAGVLILKMPLSVVACRWSAFRKSASRW